MMNPVIGQWLFYGGLAGAGLSVIGLIISKAILAGRWKKLRETFSQEYDLQKVEKK